MLVTVTNTSGGDLNDLDVHDGGSLAVGGQRKYPLPYPFQHIGVIANTGTSQLPMHTSDWRYRRVPWIVFEPKDEWNTLVHAGKVTLTVAAQADARDQEDLFINAV